LRVIHSDIGALETNKEFCFGHNPQESGKQDEVFFLNAMLKRLRDGDDAEEEEFCAVASKVKKNARHATRRDMMYIFSDTACSRRNLTWMHCGHQLSSQVIEAVLS
jgi:hypothetical protein